MRNLFSFILFSIILGCDTVAYKDARVTPTPILAPKDTVDGINFEQKIFLEDYTGHTCGNCPGAATEVKKLMDQYGKRIVVMAIHAGNFALPVLNPNKTSFKEDFRTSVGNDLDDKFKASDLGLPKGTVNRKKFTTGGSVSVLNYTEWGTRISQIFAAQGNGVGIRIDPILNTSTRVIDLKAKVIFKAAFSGKVNMMAYLVEDKIINWQKFYVPTTFDSARYEHNYMLRAGLYPKNGDYALSATIEFSADQSIETDWQGTLPGNVVPENSKIIYVLTNGNTEEVIQVAEVNLISK